MPGGRTRPIDIERKYLDQLLKNGWSKADLRLLSDALFCFRWIVSNKRTGGLDLDKQQWTAQFGLNDACGYFGIRELHCASRFKSTRRIRVELSLRWLSQWGIIASHHHPARLPLYFARATGKRRERIAFISRDYSVIDDARFIEEEWLRYWIGLKIVSMARVITFIPSQAVLDGV